MRHTRAHTGNRRSHHALSKPAVTLDAKSGESHLRHRATRSGMYKGEQMVKAVEKKASAKSTKSKKAVK